jgi:hypothetical protein
VESFLLWQLSWRREKEEGECSVECGVKFLVKLEGKESVWMRFSDIDSRVGVSVVVSIIDGE